VAEQLVVAVRLELAERAGQEEEVVLLVFVGVELWSQWFYLFLRSRCAEEACGISTTLRG
jgi:hypothetical protein